MVWTRFWKICRETSSSSEPNQSCLSEEQQLPIPDEPVARGDRPEALPRPAGHDLEEAGDFDLGSKNQTTTMARAPKKKVVLIPNGERFTLIGFEALFAAVGVVILSILGVAIHGYLRTADLVSVEASIP